MTGDRAKRVFLRARWRHLVMLNYVVDPVMFRPMVPRGTELDDWEGRTYVSVVGFLFLRTRLMGVPVPGFGLFEEVNLRFYVRRKAEDGWRRGVVFVRELVPSRVVAWVARRFYNENYSAASMSHAIEVGDGGFVTRARYSWVHRGEPGNLGVTLSDAPKAVVGGSEEEFITEHYWGYASQRDGGTMEYRVSHPTWNVCSAINASFECDVAELYGKQFVEPLGETPSSAFLAEGSDIEVHRGDVI